MHPSLLIGQVVLFAPCARAFGIWRPRPCRRVVRPHRTHASHLGRAAAPCINLHAISASDYFVQQFSSEAEALRELNGTGCDREIVDLLERNLGGGGNQTHNPPYYEPETYFVAIHDGSDNGSDDGLAGAAVGAVSAQLRRRAPLIAGPSHEGDDPSTAARVPSVPLPTPHIYVANMLAAARMRRRGVGLALLDSVREYAHSWSQELGEDIPLVLSVDNDNVGAVRLYETFGFEYLEQNDVFCVMVLRP